MVFIIWLEPWTPTPAPPPPSYHLRLLFPEAAFLLVFCIDISLFMCSLCLCCECRLVCLVASFRSTTARIRELWLASLALARFARCSSLRSLQRLQLDLPLSPPLKPKDPPPKQKGHIYQEGRCIMYASERVCLQILISVCKTERWTQRF